MSLVLRLSAHTSMGAAPGSSKSLIYEQEQRNHWRAPASGPGLHPQNHAPSATAETARQMEH
jgi:hypothetical protein